MNKYFSPALSEDALLEQRREDMREEKRRDASLDEALGFTFPASDPIALDCGLTKRVKSLLASGRNVFASARRSAYFGEDRQRGRRGK